MKTLPQSEWKSIAKGAALATIGAGLAALMDTVIVQDMGIWTLAWAAVFSTLANIIRKHLPCE
jgi:hypothetical protein